MLLNPFLPATEYIPDGEPHVFGDRVYVYGSHDLADARPGLCAGDYVCYSADLVDLAQWRYEGVIYRREQDPFARIKTESGDRTGMKSHLFAPDVVQVKEKFYLYYGVGLSESGIVMAVADSPIGPFKYVGRVRYPQNEVGCREQNDGIYDGDRVFLGGRAAISWRGLRFKEFPYDPALLFHNGRLFLYYGLLNCYVVELDLCDMRTVVKNAAGGYAIQIFCANFFGLFRSFFFKNYQEVHYVNGPSIREINGRLVLSYYATGSNGFNGMYHAIADAPEGPFTPIGPLVSLGNARFNGQTTPTDHVGNIHGGMFTDDSRWYQIYHRQTKSGRSACATILNPRPGGGFEHAEHTSIAFGSQPPSAYASWPAYSSCYLTNRNGISGSKSPVIVEYEYDCPDGRLPVVSRLRAGDVVGFKYLDFGVNAGSGSVSVEVKPASRSQVEVVLDDPKSLQVLATIEVDGPPGVWTSFTTPTPAVTGVHAVYLRAKPTGRELGELSYLIFTA